MPEQYNYRASVKSNLSDELINTYLLRPIAGIIVRLLYHTRITPNHVTVASTIAGFIAAALFLRGDERSVLAGGLCVTLKDILDSADGQLARAKKLYSRTGRFLDSIGDVVVNVAVFAAIGWSLFESTHNLMMLVAAFAALVGITLRVSYHVFYQVSYLHLQGGYEKNRILEDVSEEDLRGDQHTLLLQRVFVAIYGWQDRLMFSIDQWCRGNYWNEDFRQRWYSDHAALRLSGLLGFGTELFLLTVCSILNELPLYLFLNIVLMNGIMAGSIAYRRWVVQPRLTSSGGISEADDIV